MADPEGDVALSSHSLQALQAFLEDRGVAVGEDATAADITGTLSSLVAAGTLGGGGASDSEEDEAECQVAYDRYVRKDAVRCEGLGQPRMLTLGLVGEHHSLWGHKLWNASLVVADMVDAGEVDVTGKSVLELGAGAALPSVMAGLCGAAAVVATDYAIPSDMHLVDNIQANLERFTEPVEAGATSDLGWTGVPRGVMVAEGHVWGNDVAPLLRHLSGGAGEAKAGAEEAKTGAEDLPRSDGATDEIPAPASGFDLVFMCDLVFNRSEHEKLLLTLARSMASDGICYVTYSHHDPSKAPLDMQFFALAAEPGDRGRPAFRVEQVRMCQMVDIFLEHDGLDEERGKVFLATLRRL